MIALALTVAVSVNADFKPEAWIVVSRRSGVARPASMDLARTLTQVLIERGVPAPQPPDDATSCNAKVPCLIDLAQKKGVAVLITVEAGSALDDVVLHAEALSVEEFGKRLASFDFTGPPAGFAENLKEKIEELFAPAVRGVLGMPTPVAQKPKPTEGQKPVAAVEPKPEEPKPIVVGKQPEPPPRQPLGPLKIAGIAGMGVGGALLVTSMVFGFRTLGLEGQRKALCPIEQPCTNPEAFSLYAQAGGSQSVGVALLISGAVVAAGGAVLFFVDFGGAAPATIAPAASGDGYGLVLSGAF